MRKTVRIMTWLVVLVVGAALGLARAGGNYTAQGLILGPAGAPLAGANVSFYPAYEAVRPHSQLTTGADGRYAFSLEATDAQGSRGLIVVQKEGLAWNARQWPLLDDMVADIRLARPAELAGVIVDEKNVPIAGAAVSLQAPRSSDVRSTYISERLAQELFTTTTDGQGRFRFMTLADGWQTDFLIAAPGYATLRTRYLPDALYTTYGPGQADIHFALRPEAKVSGVVVSESDGTPIPNIEVGIGRTRSSARHGFESVVSDEAGRFRLRSLPAGDFWLAVTTSPASDPNWVAQPVPVRTQVGRTAEGVALELTRGGTLEVKVCDEQGNPIEEAWLSICDRAGHHSGQGRTDVQGVGRVRLPAGEHKLVDTGKNGYHSREPYLSFDIEKGRTIRREVTLKKANRIEGVVVDADGLPASDVRVSLMPSPVGALVTDQRGRFTMIWDKWSRAYESYRRPRFDQAPFELIARDPAGQRAATLVLEEATETPRLVLQPAVTVTGTVVDAEGRPIERVLVSSWLRGRGRWAWGLNLSPNLRVLTDRAGRFTIRCVPAERTCEIRCRTPGYEQTKQQFQTPAAAGRPFDVGTIKLTPKSAQEG